MKENRLIELLNEYDFGFEHRAYNGKIQRRIKQSKNKRFPVWWYSKSFGFIEWLVKKDKIDHDKVYDNENYYAVDVWDNTDELLMLLAISENPISDLISILK